MSDQNLVYSNTAITSASGEINIGRHTSSIKFFNTHATTNAVVKINGGPSSVLIPSVAGNAGYVELYGDYTTFQVITADVTLSVIAFG